MHLHFANLVDKQITDVEKQADGELRANDEDWTPICRFPEIEENLLLYLAVLGGKFSGYYDYNNSEAKSTFWIFQNSFGGNRYQVHGNMNNWSNDSKKFENMIAHMVFCASRRGGVRGIDFDRFFAALLGEFQDELFQSTTMRVNDKEIVASNLLERYADLKAKFADTLIPFLAPPNAEWPTCILDAGGDCNFGYLVRAKDAERLDCYVKTPQDDDPLFVCECKHWQQSLDSGDMWNIIAGLLASMDSHKKPKWNNWKLALVFCEKLAKFQKGKKEEIGKDFGEVGLVKVDCKTGEAEWIFKPKESPEKLVIVMQTGPLHLSPKG